MPSGYRQPVTKTLLSESSGFNESTRPPLISRRNKRLTVALASDVSPVLIFCEMFMIFTPLRMLLVLLRLETCDIINNANLSIGCLRAPDVFLLHPWHQTA